MNVQRRTSSLVHRWLSTLLLAALTLALGTSLAEKADKTKSTVIDSDKTAVNELTQTRVFDGNVTITKGTIVIKADRVEIKQDVEGYQTMVATGAAGKPATFKQKRDGLDETVEAEALRIDFDGKADTVLLTDQAVARRLAKGVQQDEMRSAVIKYFNQTGFYDVKGGPSSSFPGGQTRTVLAPRTPNPTPITPITPVTPATPATANTSAPTAVPASQ
jgi:lipopolysaccharide export system protein LptA